MGCSELGAEVWCREGGLTALELGDEAIVNVRRLQPGRPVRCGTSGRWSTGWPSTATWPRSAGSATSRGPSSAHLPAGRLLAGRPHRARLLDGPGPDRRARRRGLRARHRDRGRGAARGAPLRAVGGRRAVAGPDAAGPGRPARPERLPHRGDHQGRPRPGRQAPLAELRRVPRRARARRADRRRPGAAGLALGADVRVQVVPDRVAVQVQRQVLPGLAAAFLRLPEHQGHARIALAALEAEAFLVWPSSGLRRVAAQARPGAREPGAQTCARLPPSSPPQRTAAWSWAW